MTDAEGTARAPADAAPPSAPEEAPQPETAARRSGRMQARRVWGLAIAAMLGVFVGLGVYTFSYAEGLSYFSDDPNACMNCHVMRNQFEAWNHSSHKAVATCNDCHTPHHNVVAKYTVKAINGFNHSLHFTLGTFPDPIRIKSMNERVAQQNCRTCHAATVSQMHTSPGGQEADCVACHGNEGHRTIE